MGSMCPYGGEKEAAPIRGDLCKEGQEAAVQAEPVTDSIRAPGGSGTLVPVQR